MEKNNWETHFETAENLVVHTMPGGRIIVKADLRTATVNVEQDGKVIETHEAFYLSEYTNFLQGVAEKAAHLQSINNK